LGTESVDDDLIPQPLFEVVVVVLGRHADVLQQAHVGLPGQAEIPRAAARNLSQSHFEMAMETQPWRWSPLACTGDPCSTCSRVTSERCCWLTHSTCGPCLARR